MTLVTEKMVEAAMAVHVAGNREGYVRRVLSAALSAAIKENKTLREALEPFAQAADELDTSHRDTSDIWESHVATNISAGDLRRARFAYSERSGE